MSKKSETEITPPAEVRAAIEHVVDYLWDDERSDFENRDVADQESHVFESLREIQAWLNGMRPTPAYPSKSFSVRGEGWSL